MAQTLADRVRVDGQPAEAILDSSTGELRWRAAEERRLLLELDVLGLETKGSTIKVKAFVLAPEKCCLGSNSGQRARRDFRLEMPSEESAVLWNHAISDCIDSLGRPKRLFVVLNPFGGKRGARKIFSNEFKPLLDAAGIHYTLQETNYRLHAQEIAQKLDLGQYDGIVCVSGDGVLVEVINGLLQRGDWHTAIKMPLGIIPAGTGNGMAKSLLDSVGEAYSVSNAAFAIIRGHKRNLDVASITQGDTKFYSALMLTWGFVADVDIESEKYRWMGSARLGFYSLLRVMNMRKYHGCIQFVPAPGYEVYGEPILQNAGDKDQFFKQANSDDHSVQQTGHRVPKAYPDGMQWRKLDGPFILVLANNVPWTVEDVMSAPEAKFSDGYLDIIVIKDCPKLAFLMLLLKMEDGSHIRSEYIMYLKVEAFRLEPGQCIEEPMKGGIIDVDGEVIAWGEGAYQCDQHKNLMAYGPPILMTVDKGLATIFSPR